MANHKKLDLIELSDIFRRHATLAGTQHAPVEAELVEAACRFACLATWYDPYEKFRHQELARQLADCANLIGTLAARIGMEEVELPVSGAPGNPFADFFKQQVEPLLTPGIDLHLQKGVYRQDLSSLGAIDSTVKTVLDQGLRGMADIKDSLKYKWDR